MPKHPSPPHSSPVVLTEEVTADSWRLWVNWELSWAGELREGTWSQAPVPGELCLVLGRAGGDRAVGPLSCHAPRVVHL